MTQPIPNSQPSKSTDKPAPVKSQPSPIRLIVGLGNPGAEYERTRHNAGCWAVDEMARVLGASAFSADKKMKADVASAAVEGRKVWIIKPQTFMNCSGQSVGPFARFHDIRPNEVLVLHDELDLLPGQLRVKLGGSSGGHNGLKDIQAALGTPDYWRLRIGIGHPRSLQLNQGVADFVLHRPRQDEQIEIDRAVDRVAAEAHLLVRGDMAEAQRLLHTVPKL
ncbi:MAG: peptidyl-tRNA hydrolase [Pseudomonadota bacterium]